MTGKLLIYVTNCERGKTIEMCIINTAGELTGDMSVSPEQELTSTYRLVSEHTRI
jgi:hypothetical protein